MIAIRIYDIVKYVTSLNTWIWSHFHRITFVPYSQEWQNPTPKSNASIGREINQTMINLWRKEDGDKRNITHQLISCQKPRIKTKRSSSSSCKKVLGGSKKLLKPVQELSQPSPSSSIDSSICSDSSRFVVKISFPSKGNSSKKRRLERQQQACWEPPSLKNKSDQLQRRNEALRKRLEREKKKTSENSRVDLTTLTPNSKTNVLL